MLVQNFSADQFEIFFDQIFDDKIDDNSIKNFLLDLNHHNIPLNSMIGAVKALKKRSLKINCSYPTLDVCGTGGDKLNTLNISTSVAFTLSSMGVKILKHGNKAVSSQSGSADIFSRLNIDFFDEEQKILGDLNQKNLSFLFAPFFHPALKKLSKIRQEINQPTIFNYLGPLLNPANPSWQIIGLAKYSMMEKYSQVIAKINPSANIYLVHGFDGMDEITTTDKSYLLKIIQGQIQPLIIINPDEYGITRVSLEDLIGGDSAFNAQKILDLFANAQDLPYLEIVALNSAFALQLINEISDIKEAIKYCKNHIISGKVMDHLIKNYPQLPKN